MRAWFVSRGTKLDTLRATHVLAAYRDRQIQKLLPYCDEVTLPAGTVIAREGDSCLQFVVVMRGRLVATEARAASRTLAAGDSFGWDAMWERRPNSATVIVDAEARLLVMGHAQFRALKAVANS